MASTSDPLVPLKGGPTVRASVCHWLVDAEFRGLRFRAHPDGRLHVGPRDRVAQVDLDFIRLHRPDVLACVIYLESVAPC
jgi:hypothetical protein